MATATPSWSTAPPDVLWKIIKLLSFNDYFRFGAVCVSWRNAAAQNLHRPPPPPSPWWVLIGVDGLITSPLRFLSIADYKEFRFSVPEKLVGLSCSGYSNGWLVLSSKWKLRLFDPISKTNICLPCLATLRLIDAAKLDNEVREHAHVFIKVAVSQCQTSSSTFTVAALCQLSNQLGFAREGEKLWTTIENQGNHRFFNITFHREQLFVQCILGKVVAYDVSDNPRQILSVEPPYLGKNIRHYLIELSGDLLLVTREMDLTEFVTNRVRVFKMDTTATRKDKYYWVELKNIGENALFLSPGQSFAVSTKDVKVIKKDNIYFLDRLAGTMDMNMIEYDMRDRAPKILPYEFGDMIPVFWFIPHFH